MATCIVLFWCIKTWSAVSLQTIAQQRTSFISIVIRCRRRRRFFVDRIVLYLFDDYLLYIFLIAFTVVSSLPRAFIVVIVVGDVWRICTAIGLFSPFHSTQYKLCLHTLTSILTEFSLKQMHSKTQQFSSQRDNMCAYRFHFISFQSGQKVDTSHHNYFAVCERFS